jgi:hypothetical protein
LEVAKSIRAIRYLECSAKHNRGVKECFEQAAKVASLGMAYNILKKQYLMVFIVKFDDKSKESSCIIL